MDIYYFRNVFEDAARFCAKGFFLLGFGAVFLVIASIDQDRTQMRSMYDLFGFIAITFIMLFALSMIGKELTYQPLSSSRLLKRRLSIALAVLSIPFWITKAISVFAPIFFG
jgi:hypothetical protein